MSAPLASVRAAAVTIDVDSLHHYRAIHGMGAVDGTGANEGEADGRSACLDDDPIYTVAMERFWSLCESASLPATLFLIGRDAPSFASAFDPVARTGSEVASHSWSHDYRLIQQSPDAIFDDLSRADQALRPLNADRPLVGFRAPGYNISAPLMRAVARLGYRYDSSYLPSPPYFGARWAAIFGYALIGRPSRSMAGDHRQFFSAMEPHRIHHEDPFTPHPAGTLVELPMACAPLSRVPLIGTSWALAPRPLQDVLLSRVLSKLDVVNFEMHAIDLLDETDHPALRELAKSQRDLRIPAARKMRDFERLFTRLSGDRPVKTLADISSLLGGAASGG